MGKSKKREAGPGRIARFFGRKFYIMSDIPFDSCVRHLIQAGQNNRQFDTTLHPITVDRYRFAMRGNHKVTSPYDGRIMYQAMTQATGEVIAPDGRGQTIVHGMVVPVQVAAITQSLVSTFSMMALILFIALTQSFTFFLGIALLLLFFFGLLWTIVYVANQTECCRIICVIEQAVNTQKISGTTV